MAEDDQRRFASPFNPTLSQQDAGGDEGAIAYTLAALKDWTFLLGPGFIVGWGNGLILGYLLYASGLVPRKLALFRIVGGPLIILSGILVMFGGEFRRLQQEHPDLADRIEEAMRQRLAVRS